MTMLMIGLSWSNWTPHGDCSVTCGGGFQEERRECLHGVGCPGDGSRKSLQCNEQKCPGIKEKPMRNCIVYIRISIIEVTEKGSFDASRFNHIAWQGDVVALTVFVV